MEVGSPSLEGLVMQANGIAETLSTQRRGSAEAAALVETILAEMDAAVFAFAPNRTCTWCNRAGAELLGRADGRVRGRHARSLGLASALTGPVPRVVHLAWLGEARAFELRRTRFRRLGRESQLLFLSDVTRTLRRQEDLAWMKMVGVLRHEVSNAVAPIRSASESLLSDLAADRALGADDLRPSLELIHRQSRALDRMIKSYRDVTNLPPPRMAAVELGELMGQLRQVFADHAFEVQDGPSVQLQGDGDQLQQMMINLIKNAIEATDNQGRVVLLWTLDSTGVEISVEDDGPGLLDGAQVFVPFFSTKKGGSGVGLLVARRIADAHGGSLELRNRDRQQGCIARVTLPLECPDDLGLTQ